MNQKTRDRFFSKVVKTKDCWDWTDYLNERGYGQFWYNNKYYKPHRFILMLSNIKLEPDLVVDHVCRNRKCVNPKHLRQVTVKENVLCGIGIPAIRAKQTHCINGHILSGENLYIYRGCRQCKKCRYENHKRWRSKNDGQTSGDAKASPENNT